jgi:Domain of unknown function (DUF4375)
MTKSCVVLLAASLVTCRSSAPVQDTETGDFRISKPATDEDLAWKAIEPMWNRVDIYGDEASLNATMSGATPGQKAIFSSWWYRSEVNNGGHHQFFSNSTGILWKEALEGLRRLEAGGHAQVLQSAVSTFPESRPSTDREERNAQLERVDSQVLDGLDEEFYSLEDQGVLDERFLAYIRAHPEEFFSQ